MEPWNLCTTIRTNLCTTIVQIFVQPAATNLVQAEKVVHNSLPERASLKQYKSKVGQTGKHITINWLRLSL